MGKCVAIVPDCASPIDMIYRAIKRRNSLLEPQNARSIKFSSNSVCVVAQRVGAVARRIVNRAKPGVLLARGDKFGLIRFGSRTDVYLPAGSVQILVQPNDYLIA